jgi:hypothetical protein
MKITPTKIHALTDYSIGGLLLVAPWLFGFSHDSVAATCSIAFGLTTLAYSLFTDYEWSVRRVIPIMMHVKLDAAMGGLLIAAPYLTGYFVTTSVPHLVLGCVEIGAASLSAVVFGIFRMYVHPQTRRSRGMAH